MTTEDPVTISELCKLLGNSASNIEYLAGRIEGRELEIVKIYEQVKTLKQEKEPQKKSLKCCVQISKAC